VPARPPASLEQVTPAGAIAQARHEPAVQFLEDLRNRDT
jgi:hypothetical protein